MSEKKYFKVVAKAGHVGKKHYIPVAFATVAESGKDAAKNVRMAGRVKHNHKDAILSVTEISYEEYLELQEINKNDPYLNCRNVQEQNQLDLSNRLVLDPHAFKEEHNPQARKARVGHKLKLNKIIEKSY